MEPKTWQKCFKGLFLFSKFLLCTFLVNVCVMALIRINENLFFLLIFLPSFFFLLGNVYLFSFKFKKTVEENEAGMFTWFFVCYGIVFIIIIMFDREKHTEGNFSILQNNSDNNQIPEIKFNEESENYSYSIKNSKTESQWEATENLSDNILKYYEDFNEGEENPILKSIYYSTLFLIIVVMVFQGCAYVIARQIYPKLQVLDETNIQNEAIPMQNLSPAMENAEPVTNLPSSPNLSTHRRHLASRNALKPREDSNELIYDSLPVAGPSSGAAGQRIESERFYSRNNLSTSAETSFIGDSNQRWSAGTSSKMKSRGIIPE
ncbi:UNVERIFIED_CONTAM: hypothetical protein RMT77_007535 [Armadillidium vulgare]